MPRLKGAFIERRHALQHEVSPQLYDAGNLDIQNIQGEEKKEFLGKPEQLLCSLDTHH